MSSASHRNRATCAPRWIVHFICIALAASGCAESRDSAATDSGSCEIFVRHQLGDSRSQQCVLLWREPGPMGGSTLHEVAGLARDDGSCDVGARTDRVREYDARGRLRAGYVLELDPTGETPERRNCYDAVYDGDLLIEETDRLGPCASDGEIWQHATHEYSSAGDLLQSTVQTISATWTIVYRYDERGQVAGWSYDGERDGSGETYSVGVEWGTSSRRTYREGTGAAPETNCTWTWYTEEGWPEREGSDPDCTTPTLCDFREFNDLGLPVTGFSAPCDEPDGDRIRCYARQYDANARLVRSGIDADCDGTFDKLCRELVWDDRQNLVSEYGRTECEDVSYGFDAEYRGTCDERHGPNPSYSVDWGLFSTPWDTPTPRRLEVNY